MKKLLMVVLVLVCIFSSWKINSEKAKSKDLYYASQKYVTTGLFNRNKLYKVESSKLIFSDGTTSVIVVTGIEKALPHKKTSYKLFVKKNNQGIWKVKNIYPYSLEN